MPSLTDDQRVQLVSRLAVELGDERLGAAVAERMDERAVDVLAAQPSLVRTPLLSFAPPLVLKPQALVVFAFGNRELSQGELAPGPVNLEMAMLADAWVDRTGLPVIAQWEVADAMTAPVERVGVVERADGSVEYLSTIGVAEQVRSLIDVEQVAVLAMADHAVRCCRSLENVGFVAGVPEGVSLPSHYDPDSGQPWTRDRPTYVALDILARCLTQSPDVAT